MKIFTKIAFSVVLLAAIYMSGCAKKSVLGPEIVADTGAPIVSSIVPANLATSVAASVSIQATFNEDMSAASISGTTFVLKTGATLVPSTVTYANKVATLVPVSTLAANTTYSATITKGAKDLAGNAMILSKTWSFTTGATMPVGPATVNLGNAGNYVMLAQAGISSVPDSVVTGDIAVSPAAATYITGFSLSLDSGTTFSSSAQITGRVYAADYSAPTPANLTSAVGDMLTAYADAAGRTLPDYTELGAGDISGLTLVPGLYKWGTGLLINSDVYLNGSPNDVWIFQIAGDLTVASGVQVILAGGAKAKNIFWQTFGAVALGTTSHFEGIVMSYTEITMATGATANSRFLSQTAITIDKSTITKPAP